MKVRLLEPFEGHEKGSEIEVDNGTARALIDSKRAVPLPSAPTERAVIQPPETR